MMKRSLAAASGVSLRSLVGYSRHEREPSEVVVKKLATHLKFPLSFFYGSSLDEPPSDTASFRALVRMTARTRDQALATGALGLSLSDWIDERFNLPDVDVPRYQYTDPEAAAIEIRSRWALGELPIGNVVHLLELHGVRVFSLTEETNSLDAFSFWRDDNAYVFLNTMKTGERSRMDAAHELGHLVLHGHISPKSRKDAEKEAKRFASAFLMPRGSVIANIHRGATMNEMIIAKRFWAVSLPALTFRMHQVGMLSAWEYRARFAEIGRHNYRVHEPNPAPMESSQTLSKVFQLLAEENVTLNQVASNLSIYPDELNRLLFGFVSTPIALPPMPDPSSSS